MNRDGYNCTKAVNLLTAQTLTATTWSLALDLATTRADAVTFLVCIGELGADASNTLTITMQEADDGDTITTAADYSAVAAADIEGTELTAVVNATGENTIYYAGYKGDGRYVAIKLTEANTISGPVAVVALLHYLHEAPASNITVTTGQPA